MADELSNKLPMFIQQHQTLSTTLGELIAYWSQQIPAGHSGFIPLGFSDPERPVTVVIAVGPESIQKITNAMQP